MLAAVGVYSYPTLFQTVNSRLTRHVENELNIQLQRIGICSKVDNARFIEGKGIHIRGIQLTCDQGHKLAGIESVFIHVPVQLPELLSSTLKPSAIELTGATLVITRDAQGKWDIQDTIRQLSQMAAPGTKPVPLIVRDSKIRIIDRMRSRVSVVEFSDLDFHLNPLEEDPTRFAAAGTINGFGTGRFSFRCTPDPSGYAIEFRLASLPINQTTVGFLPAKAQPKEIRAVVGLISGVGTFRLNHGRDRFDSVRFRGDIQRASLDHASLPHLISNCRGTFELTDQQVEANLSGLLGTSGQFGNFQANFLHPIAEPTHWSATGKLNQFTVDSKLAGYFGPAVKKFFADFDPRGLVNIDFDVTQDESGFTRKLESELLDLSFDFVRFPYAVHHAKGTAKAINDKIWFDVTAVEQGQPLGMQGFVQGAGPKATVEVDFWNEGKIPIDKKLAQAIAASPKIAQTLFDFRPAGHIKVYGQLRKTPDQPRAVLNYDVELFGCSSQHVHFEYPIRNIDGMVYVRDGRITVENVQGYNLESRVICNGTWDLRSGLNLDFDAHDVRLDNQLASALKPDLRTVWDSIRPSGSAHFMHVDLFSEPGKPINIEVDSVLADPQNREQGSVAINPTSFPYALRKLDGKVYIGNGQIQMKLARGRHNETWMSCLGKGSYDANEWKLTLSDMMVGSLSTDADLLNAVPTELREALIALNYRGSLSGFGTISMQGRCDMANPSLQSLDPIAQASFQTDPMPSKNFEMDWDVRLEMDRASFNTGILAENVFGSLRLRGRFDGASTRCGGSIALDSLHWQEMQFTDVRGPIWIEDQRVGVGKMARPDDEATTPVSLTGNLYGGTVQLDAQCWHERQKQFFVQATLANLDINKAGQQRSTSLSKVGGTASMAFRVGGGETVESMRGEGIFELRNANIYELPVVLRMLKMMKTQKRDRSAFDASNASFTIKGDSINVDKVELLGDAISLVGKGRLSMDHDVDLDFYTVAGRNRFHIPILSDLAKASSQQILWLRVDGTMENPQVRSEILPALNESVRQLFQTAEQPPPRFEQARDPNTRWR